MDEDNRNIQRIVTAVISNLHYIQRTPSTPRAINSNSGSNRFVTPEEEIRSAFALPRDGAASTSSVYESVACSSSSCTNQTTPELGESSSRQSVSRHLTLLATSLSAGYSHLRNYSQSQSLPEKYTRRAKGKREQARSTLTGRFQKNTGSGGQDKQREPTFKDVCLLPSPNWDTVPRRKAKAQLIELGLYVDAWCFQKSYEERKLKIDIASLFHERLIDDDGNEVGFEFVRSVGTDILPITLQGGQEISGRVIKHVTGNGPIYIRALKELACSPDKESGGEDEDFNLVQTSITSFTRDQAGCDSNLEEHSEVQPTNSKKSKDMEDSNTKSKLRDIFPDINEDAINLAVSTTTNLNEAIDSLISNNTSMDEVVNVADDDVVSVLSDNQNESDEEMTFLEADDWSRMSVAWKMDRLKSVNVKGQLFKLRVDEDDILADAVAFYKDPAFDPTRPLRVSFHGQPAIDTGGVLREFFSTVKEKFVDAEQFNMFEGPHDRLLFRYDQSCLAAGIPEIFGKLVAHSLVHSCGGFPYIAPAHYFYIATGDIHKAAAYASMYDVYDTEKREMLDKLLSAKTNEELDDLNQSNIFLSVVEESGLTCLANVHKSIEIAEAIVFYHILVKRAVMLDNFAKGLQMLGVLAEIQKNPGQFEAVFLHTKDAVNACAVLEKITFNYEDVTMRTMLSNFINDASQQELESFLKFVTGIGILPPNQIVIHVSEAESIFASTCLMKLSLPEMLKYLEQDSFNTTMRAAIRQEGKSFTVC